MGSLKSRLERAERESDAVIIELKDGTHRIFAEMEIWKQSFLVHTDVLCARQPHSEFLEAVRTATPASRQHFETEYGPLIGYSAHIIASEAEGGWIEAHTLLEDGTVKTVRYEGGSEEAKRNRLEAQTRTQLP
jgi:hypothetical protein